MRLKKQKSDEYIKLEEKSLDVKPKIPTILKTYVDQVEFTRQVNGFTIAEFCKLIGLTPSTYFKVRERKTMSLATFVTYCVTFGIDMKILSENALFAIDKSPSREFAIMSNRLNVDTLMKFQDVIANSDNDSVTKDSMKVLIDGMIDLKSKGNAYDKLTASLPQDR